MPLPYQIRIIPYDLLRAKKRFENHTREYLTQQGYQIHNIPSRYHVIGIPDFIISNAAETRFVEAKNIGDRIGLSQLLYAQGILDKGFAPVILATPELPEMEDIIDPTTALIPPTKPVPDRIFPDRNGYLTASLK